MIRVLARGLSESQPSLDIAKKPVIPCTVASLSIISASFSNGHNLFLRKVICLTPALEQNHNTHVNSKNTNLLHSISERDSKMVSIKWPQQSSLTNNFIAHKAINWMTRFTWEKVHMHIVAKKYTNTNFIAEIGWGIVNVKHAKQSQWISTWP